MISDFYQAQWQQVKASQDPAACRALAEELAYTILDRHFFNDEFEADSIGLLCEMSTSFENREMNHIAASALFGIIVESLCDDFEELQTAAYNRLMSYILGYCKDLPGGQALADRMKQFGMHGFEDLYRRIERLRKTSCNYRDLPADPKKVMILSRVTIGADVAVASVLIQRLARSYPDAEIVVIGGDKVNAMISGHPRVRTRTVSYARRGGLMDRLLRWFKVLEAIDDEIAGLGPDQVLVADPDSRLSQLGVLPLVDDRCYLFFNSRSSHSYPQNLSISEMVNYWYNQVTAERDSCYPAVWLQPSVTSQAQKSVARLRAAGDRRLVSVNLGVGGNSRKRVDDEFEQMMILELLKEPETVVLLDKGFGPEELERSEALMQAAINAGYKIAGTDFGALESVSIDAKLIGVAAGIDEAAALIGCSDEFIGYDSACQHIAAAQEIPTYTIFAGSNNTRFVRRWCPTGLGRREIIHVDTLTQPPVYNRQTILMRLMHARRQ
jgi:ADP-heptose:LPS heptosyltransferase